jgi:hypothetical protein
VWWHFVAAADGTFEVDLIGSGFDTIVTVFWAENLIEVACNDDDATNPPGDPTSRVSFPVEAGHRYFVRVTGYLGTAGPIALHFTPYLLAAHPSDRVSGTLLLTRNGRYPEATYGATEEPAWDAASCVAAADYGPNTVWRSFQASATGTATVDLAGSSFDTVLTAYDPAHNELACNDDVGPAAGRRHSRVQFPVVQGDVYFVGVSGYGGAEGEVVFDFRVEPNTPGEPGPADAALALRPPAPNPARGAVRLTADLAAPADLRLEVFDVLGRRVAVVAEGPAPAGRSAWDWDAGGLPAGVYVVRLTAGEAVRTRRLTVAR